VIVIVGRASDGLQYDGTEVGGVNVEENSPQSFYQV
jgi:hypothetical protein